MKKLLKVVIALCAIVCVATFSACGGGGGGGGGAKSAANTADSSSDASTEQITGRVIAGETIIGRPTWAPNSKVFIEDRTIKIPTLWVCDHEVTQAEYKAVMGTLPEKLAPTNGDADKNPINRVTWYDAIEYCNALSKKDGYKTCYTILEDKVECNFYANGYRLPTEAEWEYLASAKTAYTYAGSNNIDAVAWYGYGNSPDGKSHEVKTRDPNGFGLYDMSGNVCEWCWDWHNNIDATIPVTGPKSGNMRVFKGGAWKYPANMAEVAYHGHNKPEARYENVGFRVVRTIQP